MCVDGSDPLFNEKKKHLWFFFVICVWQEITLESSSSDSLPRKSGIGEHGRIYMAKCPGVWGVFRQSCGCCLYREGAGKFF